MNNPIAVIEAKDNNHSISHGLQQAMAYAQMLDVPFAYSYNGDGFAEHDFLTGTGKTYTAFQIVYRMLQSEMKRKILYLADRNILVDQFIQQDFAPLEKVIHKINVAKDDKSTITSHQVYFSLYQQLVGDDDKEHFSELFTPDFFDLIIVDCAIIGLHRKAA